MNKKNIINAIKTQINTIKNKNTKYIILLVILLIVLYLFYHLFYHLTNKETFQNYPHKLTEESIKRFLIMQTTINRNINFDIEKLKYQVTQKELNYYLKHGQWYWSPRVINLYKDAISKNVLIRKNKHEAIKYARSIYNETAILEVLSLQTKEGIFLTNGLTIFNDKPNHLEDLPSGFGSFGYNSNLIEPRKDIIKCNIDPYGNKSHLERIHFAGKGGLFGEQNKETTSVNYKNLEHEIPGFKFINKPCNPCKIFNTPSDYSCKFKLTNIPNENPGISSVWKYIWSFT